MKNQQAQIVRCTEHGNVIAAALYPNCTTDKYWNTALIKMQDAGFKSAIEVNKKEKLNLCNCANIFAN